MAGDLNAKFKLGSAFSEMLVMRPSVEIRLTAAERSELDRLAHGREVWRGLSDRAQIVLLAAERLTNIADREGAGRD